MSRPSRPQKLSATPACARTTGLARNATDRPAIAHHLQVVGAVAHDDGLLRVDADLRRRPVPPCASFPRRRRCRRPRGRSACRDRFPARWRARSRGRGASCRRSVKKVKPPDTSSVFRPAALTAGQHRFAAHRNAAGARRTRAAARWRPGPSSSATRRVRLSANSSSPRMAASVISDTCGFRPCMSAISSMHSMVIRVESMSIATSRKSARLQRGVDEGGVDARPRRRPFRPPAGSRSNRRPARSAARADSVRTCAPDAPARRCAAGRSASRRGLAKPGSSSWVVTLTVV